MKVYYCTQCEKRVAVPKGTKGALCPQCDRPMILDKPKSRHRGISPFLIIGLVIAILMSGGIWVYFDVVEFDDTQTKETAIDIKSQPRASDVTPRIFDLWQLHSDDSVRKVIVLTDAAAEDLQVRIWAPSLRSGDNILSLETIGGELIDQSTHEEEYRGNMYLETVYTLLADDDQYGYDMLIDHPPHLHTNRPDRFISIGYDPQPYYAQNIIAVAIPVNAIITSIFDYQPYRSVTLDDWDIFFYDVTDISGHVSIHITFEPAGNPPSLDWTEVDEAR